MNTIPRLFDRPSWDTIASFSSSELTEFVMLAVLSVGLVAAVVYGVWLALGRR